MHLINLSYQFKQLLKTKKCTHFNKYPYSAENVLFYHKEHGI